MYACRAWVNFNGTGTVAIRASGNVSSITDNGTGDYTVNFATALQDANYSAIYSGTKVDNNLRSAINEGSYAAGSVRMQFGQANSGTLAPIDIQTVSVAIFR
jgi:hypothetical protein